MLTKAGWVTAYAACSRDNGAWCKLSTLQAGINRLRSGPACSAGTLNTLQSTWAASAWVHCRAAASRTVQTSSRSTSCWQQHKNQGPQRPLVLLPKFSMSTRCYATCGHSMYVTRCAGHDNTGLLSGKSRCQQHK
jgi:hypothetical protein